MYYIGSIAAVETDLKHYGRLGMKWGEHIFTSKGKKVSDSIKNTVDSSKQLADKLTVKKPDQKIREDVRNMSDDDLRRRVNRLQMEEQYYRMSGATKRRGAQKAADILAVTGSVVGIASGVIGIAVAIKQLSNGDTPVPKFLLKRN